MGDPRGQVVGALRVMGTRSSSRLVRGSSVAVVVVWWSGVWRLDAGLALVRSAEDNASGVFATCGVRKVTPAACLRRESPGAASGGRFRYTPELRSWEVPPPMVESQARRCKRLWSGTEPQPLEV